MVGILADELDESLPVGFLDVFHRDVLLAVDVDREQIHVAPEDIRDVRKLLVEHDVAALEQGIHRVAHDVDGSVALRQVGDVDVVDRFGLGPVGEERHQPRRPFDRVERHALQRQRVVGPVAVCRQVGLGVEHGLAPRFEEFGIDVQFLNQYILVACGQGRLAGFDHR